MNDNEIAIGSWKMLIPRRRIAVLQALTAVVAVVALIVSLIDFNRQLNDIQRSRVRSAEDTCYILQQLIYTVTPRRRLPQAVVVLKRVGMDNCVTFAIRISHIK